MINDALGFSRNFEITELVSTAGISSSVGAFPHIAATCSGLTAMAPRSFASNPKKEKEKSGEQALDSWFADIVADVDAQEYQPDLVPDHLPDIAGLCQASQPELSVLNPYQQAEIEAPAFFFVFSIYSYFSRIYS